tara:strand:- start:3356 stop:4060 length:705 start_codon:yes stop_codon:yes gene_type:complete
MKQKILIGTLTYESDKIFFDKFLESIENLEGEHDLIISENSETDSFYNLLKEKGLNVIKTKRKSNKFDTVLHARKDIVTEFLKKEYTHLFWVDSDIILPKDALKKLIESNKDIVSGIYLSPFKYPDLPVIIHPVAYKLTRKEELRLPIQCPEIKKGEIMEMHSVGFGCCLIKREPIEKIELRRIPNTPSTEDILFCADARPKGYKTFLHTEVLCKHGMKTKEGIKYIDAKEGFH